MKKTILLSLVVTSLVTGANTVNNLTLQQKNEITTTSTIDSSEVHQGINLILGASDVDNVTIKQDGTNNGNLIENSDIIGTEIVIQGGVQISNSSVNELQLTSENRIKNVELLNSEVYQGVFIIDDSNTTDTNADQTEVKSINIIEQSTADTAIDINATEIRQSVIQLTTGAKTDNLEIQHLNKITEFSVEDGAVYQGILNVDDSEVDTLYVSDEDGAYNKNTVNNSIMEGGSILQSSIDISNQAIVQTLRSKSTNNIDGVILISSEISQSETTIN